MAENKNKAFGMYGTDAFLLGKHLDPSKCYVLRYVRGKVEWAEVNEYTCILQLDHLTSDPSEITYLGGEKISFTLIPDTGYKLPESIEFSDSIKSGTYDPETGRVEFVAPAEASRIEAIGVPPKWYEMSDWWNYCSNGIEGSQASIEDVGKEVNVLINGLNHKVRLIGIDHDDLSSSTGKAHCTFEFVNLISDSNGYSLASYWKNTASTGDANFDFLNSSIRKALTSQGSGDLHWFEKDSKTWSTTYTGSVLSMLPQDLQDAIKSVKKVVNLKTSGNWVETEFTDKLFLLAPKEVGYSANYMESGVTTYKYYEGHTEQTDAIRIKAQVKGADGARTSSLSGSDLDGAYTSTKYSYAGYHSGSGGFGWLRSPYTNYAYNAWSVDGSGYVFGNGVYGIAFAVAPAFCI